MKGRKGGKRGQKEVEARLREARFLRAPSRVRSVRAHRASEDRLTAASPPSSVSNSLTSLALHHAPNFSSRAFSSSSFAPPAPLAAPSKSSSPGTRPTRIGPSPSSFSIGNADWPSGRLAGLNAAGDGDLEGYGRLAVAAAVSAPAPLAPTFAAAPPRPLRRPRPSSLLSSEDELEASEDESESDPEGVGSFGAGAGASSSDDESDEDEPEGEDETSRRLR